MKYIFIKLVGVNILAAGMILIILCMRPLLKKYPRYILCTLWNIVAIRLLCPFSIPIALNNVSKTDGIAEVIIGNTIMKSPVLLNENKIFWITGKNGNAIDLISALSYIWLGIACMLMIFIIFKYIKIKSSLATSVILKDNIRQIEYAKTPFIFGIIRPSIYVPYEIEQTDLKYIIAHENAHIKSMDHIKKNAGAHNSCS